MRTCMLQDIQELFILPEQGFDVSVTQKQLAGDLRTWKSTTCTRAGRHRVALLQDIQELFSLPKQWFDVSVTQK